MRKPRYYESKLQDVGGGVVGCSRLWGVEGGEGLEYPTLLTRAIEQWDGQCHIIWEAGLSNAQQSTALFSG